MPNIEFPRAYGRPKSASAFPGGLMGQTPETLSTIINWLTNEPS